MEFPYAIKRGKTYPIIPVTLSHGEFEIRTEALIDSGAVISTFQGELAELLGLELEAGEQVYLQGIGGRILGYAHEVDFEVGEKQIRFRWSSPRS